MRELVRIVALVVALVAYVSDARAEAPEQVRTGMALAAEGRWEEALAQFEEAHRIEPQPTTLFDVAQARLKTHRYRAALEAFRALLAARNALTARQIEVAQQGIARAEASVARLTVHAAPGIEAVTIDDAPATSTSVPLDPGTHVVRGLRGGDAIVEKRVVLTAGASENVDLAPPVPEPAPAVVVERRGVFWPGGVTAAASAGLVAAGTYFAISGYSRWSDLHDGCGTTKVCAQSDVDAVRRTLAVGDVALGLGVVAAVAAIWLLVDPPRSERARAREPADAASR